jgi:hypothetical protein
MYWNFVVIDGVIKNQLECWTVNFQPELTSQACISGGRHEGSEKKTDADKTVHKSVLTRISEEARIATDDKNLQKLGELREFLWTRVLRKERLFATFR